MQLEGEDLQDQAKDIQQLRVTKDLLQRLMENDLLSKDAKQKETLDRTLELNRNVRQSRMGGGGGGKRETVIRETIFILAIVLCVVHLVV